MTERPSTLAAALGAFFASEVRVWRGQTALPIVFWGYGVATSVLIGTLYAAAFVLGQVALQQTLLILTACYTVWIVVGIWRCSPNATQLWGDLARLLTVAWALNSAFVLVFLQIDLLVN